MDGSSTWLAGKIASLIPNALPKVTADAIVCPPNWTSRTSCVGTNCPYVSKMPNTYPIQWQTCIPPFGSGGAPYTVNTGQCCGAVGT
jgi:hypothetical protein